MRFFNPFIHSFRVQSYELFGWFYLTFTFIPRFIQLAFGTSHTHVELARLFSCCPLRHLSIAAVFCFASSNTFFLLFFFLQPSLFADVFVSYALLHALSIFLTVFTSQFLRFFLSISKLAVRPSCTTLNLIGLNEPDENLSERCLRVIDEINTFDVLFIQMALTIRMFTHRLIVQFNQNKNMTIIDSLDHNIHFMPISTEWQLWQMLFSGIQFFVYFC